MGKAKETISYPAKIFKTAMIADYLQKYMNIRMRSSVNYTIP